MFNFSRPPVNSIERIVWGLRSCFGYRMSPDGRLITTMNSANPMPPRGFNFDIDIVYEVVKDEWYGWPDFFSAIPLMPGTIGLDSGSRR